jgi:predicted nucleic acid-binding Zn ribbon protein
MGHCANCGEEFVQGFPWDDEFCSEDCHRDANEASEEGRSNESAALDLGRR